MDSEVLGDANPRVIYTIGHSTRSIEEFLKILRSFAIELLIDVRLIPRSARNPQFNIENLPSELSSAGIEYVHLKGLGGLRRPNPKSTKNLGWRNSSFRGYADYMGTEEFEKNLKILLGLAQSKVAAIMCAEAVPWKCHRFIISDALTIRGFRVEHIMGVKSMRIHSIPKWARVEGLNISYPKESSEDSQA